MLLGTAHHFAIGSGAFSEGRVFSNFFFESLSLRKCDLHEKPRNLLQSDEQCPGAPLSHLRKIPSATSGSNKGVKIVPKALSGAIARHSGDGKFYAMPHNEALVGG